ncbi:hypothetical protein [Dendrosporobacter sp. 1207_IL3150]|uniref:hypothetical protein n=1 Tax=Dendrosporobacter sp. 1207_IL3150 TaxID=3084054 RepID=UPI002FDB5951
MVLGIEPQIGQAVTIINTTFGRYTEVGKHSFLENVILDDYSYVMEFCYLQNAEVKKFANIAAMVRIGPTDHPMYRPTMHHFTYRRRMYGFDDVDDVEFFKQRSSRKTYIGYDTWIGHGAIIMPEVSIGNGAVIGSGAIVTRNVEPYTIVVGSPARVVRSRFSPDIVEKLEAIRWWDWPHDKIKANFNDFLLDAASFVKKHYKG